MKIGLLFWSNIVVCVVLIVIGIVLLSSNRQKPKQGKSVGGYICLSLGSVGILFHLISLLF